MDNDVKVDWSEIDEVAHQARVKDELTHPNFKSWFKGLLHETEINVTFFKTNGEQRTMRCTLEESKIPADKQPKGTSTRKVSDATISVFDLDISDWRSFRFESIKEFDYELDEDSDYPNTPVPVLFDEHGNEIEEEVEFDGSIQDVEYKTIQ
jgi:hypothetical protein